MPAYPYTIYDVFTDTALTGNALAVVFDADSLETERMQAIAREFNLSETVFIRTPDNPAHSAALRIFMPRGELPFAGHPTVGAAVAITERRGTVETGSIVMLEMPVGLVRAVTSGGKGAPFAEFDLPRIPEPVAFDAERETVAAALGLGPHDIGFENHHISAWSAGVPYIYVPVRGLEAAAAARMDEAQWLAHFPGIEPMVAPCPFVYCRESVNHDCDFHARMFAPHHGMPEDPATGSAAAAFAGAVVQFDAPVDGPHVVMIEQGVEMGRPSRIRLEIELEAGRISAARIGGHAIRVADGTLRV